MYCTDSTIVSQNIKGKICVSISHLTSPLSSRGPGSISLYLNNQKKKVEAMEITVDLNISSSTTIKINKVKSFFKTEKELRSEDTEIFPGKKIAFVMKPLPEKTPSGHKYTRYWLRGVGDWTAITANDKFISLELLAGEGVDPPSLAGKVEIILGDSSQSFTFGDPEKEEYLQFDDTSRRLALKPRTVDDLISDGGRWHTDIAAGLVHVELTGVGLEDTLEIKFNLFTPTQPLERSLQSPSYLYLSDQTTKIMKDESTADLKISCVPPCPLPILSDRLTK